MVSDSNTCLRENLIRKYGEEGLTHTGVRQNSGILTFMFHKECIYIYIYTPVSVKILMITIDSMSVLAICIYVINGQINGLVLPHYTF